MLRCLNARRAKCLRCEAHKPLVELVNGSRDIGLPKVRLVCVDPFSHYKSVSSSALCRSEQSNINNQIDCMLGPSNRQGAPLAWLHSKSLEKVEANAKDIVGSGFGPAHSSVLHSLANVDIYIALNDTRAFDVWRQVNSFAAKAAGDK